MKQNYKQILLMPEYYGSAIDVKAIGKKHHAIHYTYTWWQKRGNELVLPLYTGMSAIDDEWWKNGTFFSRLYRELGGTPGFNHKIHKSTGAQQHFNKWQKYCPELTKDDVIIEVRDYTEFLQGKPAVEIERFINNKEADMDRSLSKHYGRPILNRKPTYYKSRTTFLDPGLFE